MINFKQYLEQIRESTADLNASKYGPKNTKKLLSTEVDPKVQTHHDSVFGVGNHHIEIPLHNDVPDKVKYHVASQGDSIEDGQVKLKSGRKVELSKYLPRSKAPKDVQDEHENYQRNKGTGNSKLVISRHPGEVASASTGTHWSSCANLDSEKDVEHGGKGPAAKAMSKEIHHGTLIAMHVHKDAKPNSNGEYDAKDVLGRALIKRHHNEDGSSSFHREDSNYGAFPKTAEAEVDKFAEKHYPIKGGISAKKESSLYDDDEKTTKNKKDVTHEEITKAINHPNPKVVMTALNHKNVTADHISQALKNEHYDVRNEAIHHPKVNKDHITQALEDKDPDVRWSAIRHPNATAEHITTALKDKNQYVRNAAIYNSKATVDHCKQALKDSDPDVRRLAQEKLDKL